ncbi:hypothetical protein [Hymenobacter sp. BRD67]|uniref:hypothetical protein n=1 Tax=Hymenobacter sp. BRD67 TaxID=2675877 RepID=UPI0015679617|nr:hypothetical protein [Hymenobacter sp. BRD67]QKG53317.1 hypothetical protein GKZ67_12855 [Hymenobacter sp. BRD67]
MPSLNDQPNEIAGNKPAQSADKPAKVGADTQDALANSSLQRPTPAMQPGTDNTQPLRRKSCLLVRWKQARAL